MRVYVSGPMSGLPDLNVEAFIARGKAYAEAFGYEMVLPHDIHPTFTHDACGGRDIGKEHRYGCFLIGDLIALAQCDAVTVLPGWEDSPGARAEVAFAKACGIPVWGDDPVTATLNAGGEQ